MGDIGGPRENDVPRAQWIRVLGPIEVETTSGLEPVGGPVARTVLGTLVISVGHAITFDQFVSTLWGDDPPVSALNTLQSYVSRLRRLLGADAIVREDHSYVLDVDPAIIDAVAFERILEAATVMKEDPTRRRELCQQALSLWRGMPFGDLSDRDPFRLEALRLNELRLTAMEWKLRCDLDLGRADLVVGMIESAVEENPLRETLWLLLVEALAGEGRRVEALRACNRLRGILGEVGLALGAELTAAEEMVLSGSNHSP